MKKRTSKKKNWKTLIENLSGEKKDYISSGSYVVGDHIQHNLFGIGFVERAFGGNKIEVLFEDKQRILLHNFLF